MKTVNDLVACAPFVTTSVRMEATRGVARIQQRGELTRLEVLLPTGSDDFQPGDFVWVRGEVMKHQCAQEIFENEGKQFILVPREMIRAFQLNRPDRRPRPTPIPVRSLEDERNDHQ